MDVVLGVCGWPSVWAWPHTVGERPAHRSGSGVERVAYRPTALAANLDDIAHACGGGRGCY